jgi:hypothetical protein
VPRKANSAANTSNCSSNCTRAAVRPALVLSKRFIVRHCDRVMLAWRARRRNVIVVMERDYRHQVTLGRVQSRRILYFVRWLYHGPGSRKNMFSLMKATSLRRDGLRFAVSAPRSSGSVNPTITYPCAHQSILPAIHVPLSPRGASVTTSKGSNQISAQSLSSNSTSTCLFG